MKEKTIHLCNNQLVTISGTRYRAERKGADEFEFTLVDEMGKDLSYRYFTEKDVYQWVREGKIKIVY